MKAILPISFCIMAAFSLKAQKVDSIFFNLYTDSLKKGTHNYINVDGKFSDGRWLPLTSKDLIFNSTGGKFENNDLVLDKDFKEEKVTVTATLRNDTTISRNITIYIKKIEENGKLKTKEEVMEEIAHPRRKGG